MDFNKFEPGNVTQEEEEELFGVVRWEWDNPKSQLPPRSYENLSLLIRDIITEPSGDHETVEETIQIIIDAFNPNHPRPGVIGSWVPRASVQVEIFHYHNVTEPEWKILRGPVLVTSDEETKVFCYTGSISNQAYLFWERGDEPVYMFSGRSVAETLLLKRPAFTLAKPENYASLWLSQPGLVDNFLPTLEEALHRNSRLLDDEHKFFESTISTLKPYLDENSLERFRFLRNMVK